jgi:hypothetical protein
MDKLDQQFKSQEQRFQNDAGRVQMSDHHTYYWVYGNALVNGNLKMAVLGAYGTEQEAESIGSSKFRQGYEVVGLSTRDKGSATAIIKARLLGKQGTNINDVMVRMKHKI